MNVTVDEHKQAAHTLIDGSTLEREGERSREKEEGRGGERKERERREGGRR